MINDCWNPVIKIPEQEIGGYKIRHIKKPPRTVLQTASPRTMFFGQEGKALEFDYETTWHELSYDGGVWMTDFPIEQAQHDRELKGFYGHVLVAGLGLGYAVRKLVSMPKVESITVVEIEKLVIDMVWPYTFDDSFGIDRDVESTLVNSDFFVLAQNYSRANIDFDCIFIDIWQSDGEGTFHDVVVPLLKICRDICPLDNIVCWNEDVMRGQLMTSLMTKLHLLVDQERFLSMGFKGTVVDFQEQLVKYKEGPGCQFHNWAVPFWQTMFEARLLLEDAQKLANQYVRNYGRGIV